MSNSQAHSEAGLYRAPLTHSTPVVRTREAKQETPRELMVILPMIQQRQPVAARPPSLPMTTWECSAACQLASKEQAAAGPGQQLAVCSRQAPASHRRQGAHPAPRPPKRQRCCRRVQTKRLPCLSPTLRARSWQSPLHAQLAVHGMSPSHPTGPWPGGQEPCSHEERPPTAGIALKMFMRGL